MKKMSSKYKKAVYQSPQHKMGIKVLDTAQLENIFPGYRNLLKRIKSHRNYISTYIEQDERTDEQYNLMFDNVFSIMGKRGSGKTSVIYTLKQMFEENKPTDVVLPIIMSELIPASCEIIGWILSLLEQTVCEIDDKLKDKSRNTSGLFKNCRVGGGYSLREEYDQVKELCYSKAYDVKSEDSFSIAVANSERRTQNSFDFSQRLAGFWSSMRQGIQVAYGLEKGEDPLIYVIFDDVDLAPDKIWELLSTIVKYLSHPNIIVVLTADEEMLYEVVKNILYKKLENDEVNKETVTSPEMIKEFSRLYVTKILPPSTRYYLESFDTCSRKTTFIERLEFKNSEEIEHRINLKDFLEKNVWKYLGYSPDGKDAKDDFLHYEGEFIDAYLLFWGDTSRQLGNECLIIEELFADLKEFQTEIQQNGREEDYLWRLYRIVYNFAVATLNTISHHGLGAADTVQEFVNNLLEFQPEEWGIYINYSYLYDRFEQDFYGGREGDIIELKGENGFLAYVKENIQLYILLFFIENILIVEGKRHASLFKERRMRVHGQIYLIAMLDLITYGDLSLVRRDKNSNSLNRFLYTYAKILEKPEILIKFDPKKSRRVRDYLYRLPNNIDEGEELYQYYINNPKWFKTMVQTLYLAKEGIYSLTPKKFDEWTPDTYRLYDMGMDGVNHEAMNELYRSFDNIDKPVDKLVFKDEKLWPELSGLISQLKECSTFVEAESKISDFVEGELVKRLPLYQDYIKKGFRKKQIENGFLRVIYVCFLQRVNSEKYKDIYRAFYIDHYEELLRELKEQLGIIKEKFEEYRILDHEEFQRNLHEIELYCPLHLDDKMIKKDNEDEKGYHIDINYMNIFLSNIIKEAYKLQEEVYWEESRKSKLELYFQKLSKLLEIDIKSSGRNIDAAEWIVLRKLYTHIEIDYLHWYIKNENNINIDFMVMDDTKIPYKTFYENIKNMLTESEENTGNSGSRERRFLQSLIKGYIKEGVAQYLDAFSGGMA